MGLDISLYEILEFNQELIDNDKVRLFNIDDYDFIMDISDKCFIYFEEKSNFSPIPIGSKIIEQDWLELDNDEIQSYIKYITPDGKEGILLDIPIIKKYGWYILAKEISWQRKGVNKDFYLDGMWDAGNPICSLELLKQHHKKYFSGQKGGKKQRLKEKAIVEYLNLTNKELSNRFKENILSKFIEGKTFVIYH